MLTQYYEPEPGFVTADIAARLQRDADVMVITAQPNYPLGKFYPGTFRRLPYREVGAAGETIWRMPLMPDHSVSAKGRLVHYLTFLLPLMVVAPFLAGRVQAVVVYQTPFVVGFAAWWFRVIQRARVVYIAADLWPESIVAAGLLREGRLSRIIHRASHVANTIAHAIACSTQGTLQRFARDGIPRHRLHFVPVWISSVPDELPPVGDPPTVPEIVYVGNLGPLQALENIVRAAAELEREGVTAKFSLYGSGVSEPALRALVEELGVRSVTFPGRVDGGDAMRICASATAQIVSLKATPALDRTIPSKLWFAMAAGSPILAVLRGEAAELAASSGGAVVPSSDEPTAIAAAIKRLVAMNATERRSCAVALRTAYTTQYARNVLVERYAELVQEDA